MFSKDKNQIKTTKAFSSMDNARHKKVLQKKTKTVCSCHVTYTFQSESTLYSCLNVKELLARSRLKLWRRSDFNWTRTQKHLVRKRTLNHLAKWLSVRLRTKCFWVRVQLKSKQRLYEKFLKSRNPKSEAEYKAY